ncbi:MAG: C40 family peptidase [Rudaea sp.]
MLPRMVSLAVLFVLGAAAYPLCAQSLIQPSSDAAAVVSLDRFVPEFLAEPANSATAVPLAQPAPQFAEESIERSMNFDSAIAAAALTQILFKAPRRHLAAFALKLRDIRYRRGGHEPSTGFDCSGFVHYVYHQTFGMDLPYDAPGQFRRGETVARSEMKTGDLVFFGNGRRIQHVGIYLDHGRFIHSPSPGKHVRVDRLDSPYWAKRFAGAKRPHALS